MANPYFDSSEDADILEEPAAPTEDGQAASDSVKKQNFTSPRQLYGPDGAPIPEDVARELNKYVTLGSVEQRSANTPIEFRAMTHVMEFYASLTVFRNEAPIITALAHVVDEMTGGKVSAFTEFHEAERKLLYCNVIKVFSGLLVRIYQESKDMQSQEEIIHYAVSMRDINSYMHERAKQNYLRLCNELNVEPDESLMEEGCFSALSDMQKVAFGNPPTTEGRDFFYET